MSTIEKPSSRRGFLGTSVKLAGAGAAAATLGAQTTTPPAMTDVDILNYALTLEHLEARFYIDGLMRYTAADFRGGMFAANLGDRVNATVYEYLGLIRDHEVEHVSTLQTTIRGLGGVPVEACTQYNFMNTTPDQFIAVAQALENTGVSAYVGAIAMIQAPALRTAGASIATVEARHAAYLNLLNNANPFPMAFDMARTMAQVLAIATPFLVSCPAPPTANRVVVTPRMLTTTQSEITLDARMSTSADGGPLTFFFSVPPGMGNKIPAILGGSTAMPRIQFVNGFGEYVILVTIMDSMGRTATDTVRINFAGTN